MNKLDQSIKQSLEELQIDGYTLSNAIFIIRNNIWELLVEDEKDSNLVDAKNYISYLMKDKKISLEDLEKLKDRILLSDANEIDTIQYFYNHANQLKIIFSDHISQNNWKNFIELWNVIWILKYKYNWEIYAFKLSEFNTLTANDIVNLSQIIEDKKSSIIQFELEDIYVQKNTIH